MSFSQMLLYERVLATSRGATAETLHPRNVGCYLVTTLTPTDRINTFFNVGNTSHISFSTIRYRLILSSFSNSLIFSRSMNEN